MTEHNHGGKRVNSGRKRLFRDIHMRVTLPERQLIEAIRKSDLDIDEIFERIKKLHS